MNEQNIFDELKLRFEYNLVAGGFTWKNPPKNAGRRFVGLKAGRPDSQGYTQIRILGATHKTHRLVWLWHHGCFPPDQIDHINMVKNDNRIENLRLATPTQNCQYRIFHKEAVHGRGVRKKKRGRFCAEVKAKGKQITIGRYDTAEEARIAYQAFIKNEWGEFCPLKLE